MAEAEVEQQRSNENGLQWTLGDDDGEGEERSEQEDTFGGEPETTPSSENHHGLSAAHLLALQEKRKRLK